MAETSKNSTKDRPLDFKGFLKDLNAFDYMHNGKDQKRKVQDTDSKKQGSLWSHDQLPTGLWSSEKIPDAASEKELGNEYFKQKKYHEAIDCYSRSIALAPTAVSFANRAMAYIKVKRFKEAENDCTEALNLDDRYVKAYSRRATARKELGNYKASMEDSDFAVRLEPNNQELRKQYTEAKELLEKEITKNTPGPSLKSSGQGMKMVQNVASTLSNGDNNGKVLNKPLVVVNQLEDKHVIEAHDNTALNFTDRSAKVRKQDQELQDLASRAASRAMANAAKNISAPKSAYEFEVTWRALSGDSAKQSCLLKTIQPSTLPQIFKNALSAPMLIEIIKCTATIFREDTEFAASILDNLAKVPRFDMIIMCLSAVNHAEICCLWEQVFSAKDIQADIVEVLGRLQPKFCYGGLQSHVLGSSGWPK